MSPGKEDDYKLVHYVAVADVEVVFQGADVDVAIELRPSIYVNV